MRTLLKNLFINHWPRKCLSIILAIIIWFVVHKSLTTTKTINSVPVRIENIPPGKTVEGVQSNGLLNKRINLTLEGNKKALEELNTNSLEVAFDVQDQEGEWIATVGRKNLRIDGQDANLVQGISRVSEQNFIIKLTKLISEKIPITITEPIGEAPAGYEFIDVWPYQLFVTVSGPEEVVKNLKSRGVRLTFNLNDITKSRLDELSATQRSNQSEIVSFFVPNFWKQISIPPLSPTPIEINDPDAKFLRIDFLRSETLKLNSSVPVSLYFPPSRAQIVSPTKFHLAPNGIVENRSGIKMLTGPLYVKGVSALFLDIIKDMVEISVVVHSNEEGATFEWSPQFINPNALEEKYLRCIKSDSFGEEFLDLQPHLRDSYLRNRFRSYMNRFKLYKSENKPLDFIPKLQGHSIVILDAQENES